MWGPVIFAAKILLSDWIPNMPKLFCKWQEQHRFLWASLFYACVPTAKLKKHHPI